MNLITMKCPACAANLTVDNNNSFFKCEYCKSQIGIIKPIHVSSDSSSLNENEQKKFANYISILEQSMKAGNYTEAYNYCNKALEINPNSSSLWENKAICSFWMSSIDSLSTNSANEIITYLNASKQNNPNSNSYDEIAGVIADNLFTIAVYKYNHLSPALGTLFSPQQLHEHLMYLELMELSYLIFPKIEYLKNLVDIFASGKIKWVIVNRNGYNNSFVSIGIRYEASMKLNYLIQKVKNVDPSYNPISLYDKNRDFYRVDPKSIKILAISIIGIVLLILLLISISTLSH